MNYKASTVATVYDSQFDSEFSAKSWTAKLFIWQRNGAIGFVAVVYDCRLEKFTKA